MQGRERYGAKAAWLELLALRGIAFVGRGDFGGVSTLPSDDVRRAPPGVVTASAAAFPLANAKAESKGCMRMLVGCRANGGGKRFGVERRRGGGASFRDAALGGFLALEHFKRYSRCRPPKRGGIVGFRG